MVRLTSDIMSISSCFVTFDSVHFEVGRIFELLFWDVVPLFWLKREHLWFLPKHFVSRNVMGHLSAFTTQHHGVRDTQQVVNTIIITKYDQA